MRSSDLPQIRELPLFSSMSETVFEELMSTAYLQVFPPQLDLLSEGDPADFLYIVVDGAVELYASSNRRETTMAVVTPVSTFILAAVLKDAVYLMSARTAEKSQLLLIPAENIKKAFETDPAFARAITGELASCYRGVIKAHKDLKLRTAVERLANRLLRYHEYQGGGDQIVLPYDKKTLASLLGMTPENLSRAFNTLKPYGVVVDGANIHLNDLQSLETLAKPNQLIDDKIV